MAILRMLDLREGKITVSDTDITTVPRSLLRSTINVIPQEPLLLPGTVRFNLDPQGFTSDDRIEYALRKVGMWKLVLLKGGLDAELEVQHWSVGQKQLFELARAIVVRSPILILDEATSRYVDDCAGRNFQLFALVLGI
jgi:ABC-type multidrug transport system fused ATPase/permease subunit